jgi:hypothetical protein
VGVASVEIVEHGPMAGATRTVDLDKTGSQTHNPGKGCPESVSMIPENISDDLKLIAEEADRIHESVLWSSQGQFEQVKLWRAMNMVFGVPAAILAAVSGGTG